MAFEVRADRSPQGPKPLLAERTKFFELISNGYGFREAAKIVGVTYRTTKRWRSGDNRTKKAGMVAPIGERPYRPRLSSRYLSEHDRVFIADRVLAGWSLRAIAAEMKRSPSTISREISRNAHPDSGVYRPYAAQARADSRRPRPKVGKIASNGELRAFVQAKLDQRWSPEQISRALRQEFPNREEMRVVHETIYLALYVPARGGLRRDLHRALRTGRARRKSRRQAQRRQPRYRDPMVMICDRPQEVDARKEAGHWEGDLIVGKNNRSAIGTLVERVTRYVMLVHLPRDHGADAMLEALTSTIERLPAHLRLSLTWDQGSEMGKHRSFTEATSMPVYFCDPASPWQRGSNENTNGLLRQYFPKSTDLSVYDAQALAAVARELNTRPRKTLDWGTPAERLAPLWEVAA